MRSAPSGILQTPLTVRLCGLRIPHSTVTVRTSPLREFSVFIQPWSQPFLTLVKHHHTLVNSLP